MAILERMSVEFGPSQKRSNALRPTLFPARDVSVSSRSSIGVRQPWCRRCLATVEDPRCFRLSVRGRVAQASRTATATLPAAEARTLLRGQRNFDKICKEAKFELPLSGAILA